MLSNGNKRRYYILSTTPERVLPLNKCCIGEYKSLKGHCHGDFTVFQPKFTEMLLNDLCSCLKCWRKISIEYSFGHGFKMTCENLKNLGLIFQNAIHFHPCHP